MEFLEDNDPLMLQASFEPMPEDEGSLQRDSNFGRNQSRQSQGS